MTKRVVAHVALPYPFSDPFDYLLPDEIDRDDLVGCRASVPFGGRLAVGVILAVESCEVVDGDKLKHVDEILDETPLLDSNALRFLAWVSDYYFTPIGELLRFALPLGLLSEEKVKIALGAKGRQALAGLPVGVDEKEIKPLVKALSALPKSGGIAKKTFFKRAGAKAKQNLSRWESLGFINVRAEEAGSGVGVKKAVTILAVGESEAAKDALKSAPAQWAAYRALCEAGEVERAKFIAKDASRQRAVRALIERGFVQTGEKELGRSPIEAHLLSIWKAEAATDISPTESSQKAVDEIIDAVKEELGQTFLLKGESGLSEVYLRAIEETLTLGKSAIILTPDITQAPRLASLLYARFKETLAIMHTKLSQGERYDEWRRIRKGRARVVVGSRLALFSPVERLGLIVVDNEQDAAYKANEPLLFHARDASVMLASMRKATALLSSATPSVESYWNAKNGRYGLIQPAQASKTRPQIKVIDALKPRLSKRSMLSPELVLAIKKRLKRAEQTLLLHNRRGYAPTVACMACGTLIECAQCAVALTYHRTDGALICHTCGSKSAFPPTCPACKADALEVMGIGIQKIEDEIARQFPEANIERFDADTTSNKNRMITLLRRMEAGDIDILIGTRLLAFGHEFNNVTLAGVLNADATLHFQDFRATEQTWQLLRQFTGRLPLDKEGALAIVQTYQPKHFAIRRLVDGDDARFYSQEINDRKGLYPPFKRLAIIRFESEHYERVEESANATAESLRQFQQGKETFAGIQCYPAMAASVLRMRGRYRLQTLLKSPSSKRLHRFLNDAIEAGILAPALGVRIFIDIDPARIG